MTESGPGLLCKLSDDLVLTVFSFLGANDLSLARSLSSRFKSVASEDMLWHELLLAELGSDNIPADCGVSWRKRFDQWRLLTCSCIQLPAGPAAPQVSHSPNAAATPARIREPLQLMCQRLMTDSPILTRQARFLHRAACTSGRWLFVFGGQGRNGELNDVWMLDKQAALEDSRALSGPAWKRITPEGAAPRPRQSATLTAVGGKLLMFGGREGDINFMNDTWLFDTVALRWTCHNTSDPSPMFEPHAICREEQPSPRWAHTAVRFGQRVLFFGGSAPGQCFNDMYWFDTDSMDWSRQWLHNEESIDSVRPRERCGHCACAVGDSHMYVFGGNTTCDSFNDLWLFDIRKAEWSLLETHGSVPSGRVGHTLTSLGSRLLLLGGREYSSNKYDNEIRCLDVHTKQWATATVDAVAGSAADAKGGSKCRKRAAKGQLKEPPRPFARTGHCADAHEGRLFIFGGLTADSSSASGSRYLEDMTVLQFIA